MDQINSTNTLFIQIEDLLQITSLLTVMISIVKEYIQTRKQIIVKDSEEEYVFVKELIEAFKNIDMSNLFNIE